MSVCPFSDAAGPKRNCGGLPSDTLVIDGSPSQVALVSAGQSTYLLHNTGKADAPLQFFPVTQLPKVCGGVAGAPVTAATIPTVSGQTLAGGDFNGDGIPDAVSVALTAKTISVFIGAADGSMQPGATYSLGSNLLQVSVADMNNDRRLDLIVVDSGSQNEPGSIYILLGAGDGTFRTPIRSAIGETPVAFAIADFDSDGRLDVAVADSAQALVFILFGKGDGTFASVDQEPVDEGPVAVLAADFDRDGRPDLAVSCSNTGSVSILLGSGTGTFQPAINSRVSFDPGFLASGDFNGDGKTDLAVLFESSNSFSILTGRGDGFFSLPTAYLAGKAPKAVALVDLDGDGSLDILTPDPSSHGLVILFGKRDGSFDAPPLYQVGLAPRALAVADFNGDGKADLVAANEGSNDVSVLLGGGDGSFRRLPNTSLIDPLTFPRPVAIGVGDFNRDGAIDVVVAAAAPTNQVTILLGKGNGTFLAPKGFPTGPDPQSVLLADFNGDGVLDLATANGNRQR